MALLDKLAAPVLLDVAATVVDSNGKFPTGIRKRRRGSLRVSSRNELTQERGARRERGVRRPWLSACWK